MAVFRRARACGQEGQSGSDKARTESPGSSRSVPNWAVLHCELLVHSGCFMSNPPCAAQNPTRSLFRFFSCCSSCYGTVSSLNGEPEQGVAVEAVGQSDCSIYGEDTVTDEEGKFRLRGLLVRRTSFISGIFTLWFGAASWCLSPSVLGTGWAGVWGCGLRVLEAS